MSFKIVSAPRVNACHETYAYVDFFLLCADIYDIYKKTKNQVLEQVVRTWVTGLLSFSDFEVLKNKEVNLLDNIRSCNQDLLRQF